MTTKIKTSSKKIKQTIKKNNNFLNNQNYVLGKNEKEKILNKFFIENNILFILNVIYKFKQIFNFNIGKEKNLFIEIIPSISILYCMFILYLGYSFIPVFFLNNFYLFILYTYFLFFIGLILPIFFIKYYYIKKYNKKIKIENLIQIKRLKNLFFAKNNTILGIILQLLFAGLPLISVIILLNKYYILSGIIFIIFLVGLFFLKKLKKMTKLKFTTILFLPLFIILEILIGLYYFLKFLLFGVQKYKIIKKGINKNFKNKFLLLDKNYGENLFYKIERKKL